MADDRQRLTEQVKAEARRLGFQLVGVTTPDPPPHLDVFASWLKAGRHGEMGYLATERSRQRRADPREILPECRSVLALGAPYSPSYTHEEMLDTTEEPGAAAPGSSAAGPAEAGLRGRIAAYAWGADYHDVLPERLQALVAFIEAQVGGPVPNRWYTDTGPILERELAQRAGLGWIGKNTCLIHPQGGSYFLLAEILLGVELEPDAPITTDHCGTCTRCLEACPTGCILPDRTLDARRCISYLTIELKDSIAPELRPQMGEWVFGCDICQQVCPWNLRFGEHDPDPAFSSKTPPRPDLIEELETLTSEAFNRKFKKTPVARAKRRGYLRNVAVALGNVVAKNNGGDPSATPALARALREDPEPLVRGHAAWALGCTGEEAARTALIEAAKNETDETVLAEIQQALQGGMPPEEHVEEKGAD